MILRDSILYDDKKNNKTFLSINLLLQNVHGTFPVFSELWRKRILRGISWTRIPALYDTGLTQEFRHWRSVGRVIRCGLEAALSCVYNASRNPSRFAFLAEKMSHRPGDGGPFRRIACPRSVPFPERRRNDASRRCNFSVPRRRAAIERQSRGFAEARFAEARSSWKFVCSEWQGDCTCHAALRNRDVHASNVTCRRFSRMVAANVWKSDVERGNRSLSSRRFLRRSRKAAISFQYNVWK